MITNNVQRQNALASYKKLTELIDNDFIGDICYYSDISDKKTDKLINKIETIQNQLFSSIKNYEQQLLKNL